MWGVIVLAVHTGMARAPGGEQLPGGEDRQQHHRGQQAHTFLALIHL